MNRKIRDFVVGFNLGINRKSIVVGVGKSTLVLNILNCLLLNNYIRSYKEDGEYFVVYLNYNKEKSIISKFELVSLKKKVVTFSGKDVYREMLKGNTYIITTSSGVILNGRSINMGKFIGGVVLLKIN